jgi:ATP-dependent Clp protease ATP-binding subunit ClpA
MFERFTDTSRSIVVKAQEEARLLLHNYIGTEHVLLGLFASPDTGATRALNHLGVSREAVLAEVESIVGLGREAPSGHIPFTARAKKSLELALREALQLKHNYIGPEHILLGLVREGEGVAAQILINQARDLDAVRQAVLAELSDQGVEARPASAVRPKKKATGAAKEVIAAAEALAGGAPVGSHHLLEAMARAEGSMAAKVFAALGLEPDAISAKVDELDPEDTTDATPEEVAARKMELRVVQGEVHLVFRDAPTVALAKQVTDLAGGPVHGTGPVSGAFVPLWTSTNDLLLGFLRLLHPEPEGEEKDVGGKATVMMRRVMRGRLQARRRPPEQG